MVCSCTENSYFLGVICINQNSTDCEKNNSPSYNCRIEIDYGIPGEYVP